MDDTTRDFFAQFPVTSLIVGLSLTLLIGVVAYYFSRMLLSGVHRSADARPPLITAMSLLGILGTIGLIGALFTKEESAYTIAATVVGGLTGYLTAQAQQNKADGDDGTGPGSVAPELEPEPEPTPAIGEPMPDLELDPGDDDDLDDDTEDTNQQ